MQRTLQNIEAMMKIAWVQSDRCELWVHYTCVNLGEEDVEDATFFCV